MCQGVSPKVGLNESQDDDNGVERVLITETLYRLIAYKKSSLWLSRNSGDITNLTHWTPWGQLQFWICKQTFLIDILIISRRIFPQIGVSHNLVDDINIFRGL